MEFRIDARRSSETSIPCISSAFPTFLQRCPDVRDYFPALELAQLSRIRRHLLRAQSDYMEESSGLKLEEAVRLKGRRTRNFLRNRPVAFASLPVADRAIGLVQRFAFLYTFGRAVGVLKFDACPDCFLFAWTIVERLIVPGDRSDHRALHRHAVSSDRIWRECLVSGIADHIGHVLITALFRTGAAS